MKKYLFTILFLCFLISDSIAQGAKSKVIDNGGSGQYKAVAVSEKSLPDFVVYRPENIGNAAEKEGKLPVMVFANGGCADSSINHERVLSEIASQGYIVVAIGSLQMTLDERQHESTDAKMLLKAINWITKQAKDKDTDYYGNLDLGKIAAAGQSCGGAQILAVAGDSRIKTYMMFNSGMGEMTMAGASSKSLESLNGNILYIVGGESDVATNNAEMDYSRIKDVPVAFANLLEGGHMGTFGEEYGGSFSKMAVDWLDWQLKGKDNSSVFLENNLNAYSGWAMKAKNFEHNK
ncbi:hypothetical protein RM549_04675 [Salegentibacter sp. F188]|uniref:Alpha/beta hydrolase n=1 Tax=Autumnicola patrickiae TaxID=3075591 RepID=A0ABU3E1D5_9FLAO|nr:hypothetical protein [Salegentibacter sp. F188]MDT0689067.1 hypothetical protein [Salegentibacter sp. F188]